MPQHDFEKLLPGDDPEALERKASEQLGTEVQYKDY